MTKKSKFNNFYLMEKNIKENFSQNSPCNPNTPHCTKDNGFKCIYDGSGHKCNDFDSLKNEGDTCSVNPNLTKGGDRDNCKFGLKCLAKKGTEIINVLEWLVVQKMVTQVHNVILMI